MRFLLTRRWLLFALAVAVLAWVAIWLGEWQFSRLQDRQQRNEWTTANLAADPVPVAGALAVGQEVPPDREWLRVVAVGEYDAAATVVVRYQTRDGKAGIDLVTPLRTEGGPALLVDRGWLETGNTGTRPDDLPAPPTGRVEVVGWVRADATGDSTAVEDGSTRAVSSRAIGAGLGYRVYGGFVDAISEDPEPAQPLVRAEQPDLGEGPHFFYGLQWWFFGLLAIGGFGYLVYDERRRGRAAARPAPAPDAPLPADRP